MAIKELSQVKKGVSRKAIDYTALRTRFQQQFSLQLPTDIVQSDCNGKTKFDYWCQKILDAFSKGWRRNTDKTDYIKTFSSEKWEGLSDSEKEQHSLSNCEACYSYFANIQLSFPLKPHFTPQTTTVQVISGSEKQAAKRLIRDANEEWAKRYGHSLTEAIPRLCPETALSRKKTKQELKKESRERKRKYTAHVNKQMAENATIHMLASGQSFSQYNENRMSTSFQKSTTPTAKAKQHSPSETNFTWDTQAVLHDLTNFPPGQQINWSEFARNHQVPGKNCGQVVKEYAKKKGINTVAIDNRPEIPRER